MNEDELSNAEWIRLQIKQAKSMERLEFLSDIIKFDVDDGEQSYGNLEELRELWIKRKQELKN